MVTAESPSFRCTRPNLAVSVELLIPLLLMATVACSMGMGQSQNAKPATPPATSEPVRVMVEPATATVAPNAQKQFIAIVQGTDKTAVTWSASAGSISSSGLFTAPQVAGSKHVTVMATSVAHSVLASALVTVQPAGPLAITTSSLMGTAVNNSYSATISAAGGTPPYKWTISAGTLAPGITLNAYTGALTGTATRAGTNSFTAKVLDAASNSATQNLSLTISGAAGNFDGPAELPRTYLQTAMTDTPAPGSTVTVKAGDDLQSALNNASCGDTIELQAGATFTGSYTLPAKSCDAAHWIIIRTSAPDGSLPAEGTRMTPCYAGVSSLPGRPALNCSSTANVLVRIISSGAGEDGPIVFASGANHYRLLGLEITRTAGSGIVGPLVGSKGSSADQIVVDRVWIHGAPADDTRIGFELSGMTNTAVVSSFFTDFHCTSIKGQCTDAHAVSGGVGSLPGGPYKIVGNFLEASGENVFFGGGAATTTPADIEIRSNHFFKPLIWQPGQPGFVGGQGGYAFIVKNHFELKNAQRVLFEGNILENNWGGFTQEGHSILLCPKNQHSATGDLCPLCQVTDVTVRYSTISHVGGGIKMGTSISGNGTDGAQALAGARWSLHDIIIDDVSSEAYKGDGNLLVIANGWPSNVLNNVTINHITGFPDPTGSLFYISDYLTDPQMSNVVITNNIFGAGRYPVWNLAGGTTSCAYSNIPVETFSRCFNPYAFNHNALVASPQAFPPSRWPRANFFPPSTEATGFVDYGTRNYALSASSPYKNAGSDGKDLGADSIAIQAAIAGVQ